VHALALSIDVTTASDLTPLLLENIAHMHSFTLPQEGLWACIPGRALSVLLEDV